MPDRIRFGLIGTGGIAQSYVTAFENHPDANLVAVCDVRAEAAQAMAERVRCAAFTSIEEMVQRGPEMQAVVVCTPPSTHEEIVCNLAKWNLHVLCEKPFALSVDSAKRMIASAQQHRVQLTMASKFRYTQDMIRLKSLIASGVLGEIQLLENAFTGKVDMSQRWNAKPAVSGGGVLVDNGTHSVDIVRYLLGPVKLVHAIAMPNIQKLEVEDSARLLVQTASGIPASIDLTWSLNKELDWFVSVFGTHGVAQVGWRESRYKQSTAREWIRFGNGYDKVQAFRDELGNFARCCRENEQLLINSDDALASVHVIEQAYQAMKNTNWLPLE
ncbi:MAG: Gfo/Idh/MocA family oxidoreductase [Zavarzinella sp.]